MDNKFKEFHEKMLDLVNVVATDDHYLVFNKRMPGKMDRPIQCEGKNFTLVNYDVPDEIPFVLYPEQLLVESPSFDTYRQLMAMQLNTRFALTMMLLLRFVFTFRQADVELDPLMPPAAEFLKRIRDLEMDSHTPLGFQRLLQRMSEKSPTLLKFATARHHVLEGVSYKRVTHVTTPLYEQLLDLQPGDDIDGLKIRQKDRAIFVSLMEYILPDIQKVRGFDRGSNDEAAPSLDALMRSALLIGDRLDQVRFDFISYGFSDTIHYGFADTLPLGINWGPNSLPVEST